MIFDLDRQALDRGVEARPLGDCPAQKNSAELETKVVMEPAGAMFLHDEGATRWGWAYPRLRTERLGRAPGRAFTAIFVEGHF